MDSSVLRCHLAGLLRFFLLEFRSSVPRRHYSLLATSFISSLNTCFFFTFLLPPLNFPVRDWGDGRKRKKKVTASRPSITHDLSQRRGGVPRNCLSPRYSWSPAYTESLDDDH